MSRGRKSLKVEIRRTDAVEVMRGLVLLADYRKQVEGEDRPLLKVLQFARRAKMLDEFWKAIEKQGPVEMKGIDKRNLREMLAMWMRGK